MPASPNGSESHKLHMRYDVISIALRGTDIGRTRKVANETLQTNVFTDSSGWTVVSVAGKLTVANSQSFETAVDGVMRDSKIAVDLADVEYVSSAGLRVLVSAMKTAVRNGSEFELRNPNESVMEIFEITGLDDVLPIKGRSQ